MTFCVPVGVFVVDAVARAGPVIHLVFTDLVEGAGEAAGAGSGVPRRGDDQRRMNSTATRHLVV